MTAAQKTWATQRLDEIVNGPVTILPPVVQALRLGGLEAWGIGWIKKRWQPHPDLLNVDGSLFGGYIAALADQALAFAAMTVVPADRIFRTIYLNVNFIRVGRAHPLEIEGVVVAQTQRVLTVRATLRREDGELIAEASAQQVLQSHEEIQAQHVEAPPNNALEPTA